MEALKHGERVRLVNTSSSSVYGAAAASLDRREAVLRPLSPYGQTKLGAELFCLEEWSMTFAQRHEVGFALKRQKLAVAPQRCNSIGKNGFGKSASRPVEIVSNHQRRAARTEV